MAVTATTATGVGTPTSIAHGAVGGAVGGSNKSEELGCTTTRTVSVSSDNISSTRTPAVGSDIGSTFTAFNNLL